MCRICTAVTPDLCVDLHRLRREIVPNQPEWNFVFGSILVLRFISIVLKYFVCGEMVFIELVNLLNFFFFK
jgi:hypothetical protein